MKYDLFISSDLILKDSELLNILNKRCIKSIGDFSGETKMTGMVKPENVKKYVTDNNIHVLKIEVNGKNFKLLRGSSLLISHRLEIYDKTFNTFSPKYKKDRENYVKIAREILFTVDGNNNSKGIFIEHN